MSMNNSNDTIGNRTHAGEAGGSDFFKTTLAVRSSFYVIAIILTTKASFHWLLLSVSLLHKLRISVVLPEDELAN
jgi:hypothetical protein